MQGTEHGSGASPLKTRQACFCRVFTLVSKATDDATVCKMLSYARSGRHGPLVAPLQKVHFRAQHQLCDCCCCCCCERQLAKSEMHKVLLPFNVQHLTSDAWRKQRMLVPKTSDIAGRHQATSRHCQQAMAPVELMLAHSCLISSSQDLTRCSALSANSGTGIQSCPMC